MTGGERGRIGVGIVSGFSGIQHVRRRQFGVLDGIAKLQR